VPSWRSTMPIARGGRTGVATAAAEAQWAQNRWWGTRVTTAATEAQWAWNRNGWRGVMISVSLT
jgi:hypothetical protein